MKSFTLRAVLTSVVITASVLFASPAWATFPGTNGQIVFAALPTPGAPGHQIFTIEPNGTNLRQLTHLDGDAFTPHWSPARLLPGRTSPAWPSPLRGCPPL